MSTSFAKAKRRQRGMAGQRSRARMIGNGISANIERGKPYMESLDDQHLGTIEGDAHRNDQNQPEHDLLREQADADEGHADPRNRYQQGADQRSGNASRTARQCRPADDHRRDDGQQELVCQRGRAAAEGAGHPPPAPPVGPAPPTIPAAMTGRRNWSASVGEPLPRRPAITTPASPAKNDEVANTRHLVTGTRRPDAIAAGSPAPMASVCRPKTVERCRNRQNANTAMPSKISCGTPNEVPVVQPSDALRISWPIPMERVPESVSAAAEAIPPTASVAMKEGMRSAVWMTPLSRPTPNAAASATTAANAP